MRFTKIKAALVAAVALGGVGIAAPAALASGPSSNGNSGVTASASVGETITLSNISPTVNFGQLTASTTSQVTNAEAETVATNDPAGWTLSIIPGSTGLMNGSATISNNDIQIQENAGVAVVGNKFTFSGSNVLLLDTEGASNTGDVYSENWFLNTPAILPNAGSYAETFTYLAMGQ